ncbi:bifunctional ADP-dependent NAD(P)H-hydrate dehydratase/NAD(P)H-hydrate epimerase [Actinobaculum suis]|uniref:bifunctional ADP-dependent NAD(P)H-hydrate dehydratase/NAD(P)H-hydrate epimerase n=1 Tax=Actinobaculum suis TaxID=1657 RepID=UPI00163B9879|nr:bifunctional ADP-dependent NAD(P)H-hydrate dehydratase/NAD(P)H-hydrate epimerase [Actinobaculum suis]
MLRTYEVATVQAAEAPLLAAGVPLMKRAARALANRIIWELRTRRIRLVGAPIAVFVGGGNNGGDALYAAAHLAARGAQVRLILCAPQVHAAGLAAAQRAGARLAPGAYLAPPAVAVADTVPAESAPAVAAPAVAAPAAAAPELSAADLAAVAGAEASRAAVWIDGLLGIGARGPAREPIASVLEVLNAELDASPMEPLVVAVDTPSGIDPDTGAVPGPALRAHITVTMGAAKAGLVVPPACGYAGKIDLVKLGFAATLGQWAVATLSDADVADLLDIPGPEAHKYTRGVAGILAGSAPYPGAGLLATKGARAMGPGYVRYLGEAAVGKLIAARYPDVVLAPGRVQAYCVGSGNPPGGSQLLRHTLGLQTSVAPATPALGEGTAAAVEPARGAEPVEPAVPADLAAGVELAAPVEPACGAEPAVPADTAAQEAISTAVPVVIDAGCLDDIASLLAEIPGGRLPEYAVLTPHAGEAARLLAALGHPTSRETIEATPLLYARKIARLTGATVVLKGAVDIVASPGGQAYAQGGAPGWRGVAGSGDVLAGAIAALLAMHPQTAKQPGGAALLAAAAAHIHGRAAARAADCEFGWQLVEEPEYARAADTAPALGAVGAAPGRPLTAASIAGQIAPVIGHILGNSLSDSQADLRATGRQSEVGD